MFEPYETPIKRNKRAHVQLVWHGMMEDLF